MRRIIYLNNFMTEKVVNCRKNQNVYSQPANNKIAGITEALIENNCEVKILSSGLVNGKSGRFYNKLKDMLGDVEILYSPTVDLPLINTVSSIFFTYIQIKKEHKKKKIDNIIFYNYKPEVAWAAWLAKKRFHIPITVEYEDGYSYVNEIRGLKAKIFNYTEEKVKKSVDSAILVNSHLEKYYSVPNVVVRGIVNKDFYQKCKTYKKVDNDKFTIVYSGGLDEERGIEVFLESLKYNDIDCKVVVSGKGNIQSNDSRLDFKGFISYEEVQKLLMQSDVLVQCQLSKNKFANASFPSKLFEYIATGNMIVSSDIDEVKAFAGDAFVYYEDDDPQKLAEIIKVLYRNKGLSREIKNKLELLCEKNMPKSVGESILKILA